MEASHYHRAVDAPPLRWLEIPDLGCTHSAMTTVPVTDPTNDAGAGPVLEYDIHLLSEGEIEVRAVLSPTLDFRGGGGLRYAVSIETRSRRSSTCMTAGPRRSGKKRSGTTLT